MAWDLEIIQKGIEKILAQSNKQERLCMVCNVQAHVITDE